MERFLRSVAAFHAGQGRVLQPKLEKLAREGQEPEVLMLTCADSRILVDPLASSEPGVVFSVRNVGNLVPSGYSDPSVTAAVQYGVTALKIPDIVVMGHSECGAMKASLGYGTSGAVGEWLRHAEESVRRFRSAGCPEGQPEHDCLSQTNVLVQVERVRAMPWVRDAGTKVHAWWWDMANAQVLGHNGERFVPIEQAYAPESVG